MPPPPPAPEAVAAGVAAVRAALDERALVVVSAGAGMGVDSGLPDFRGPEGFWAAYPPYRHLGLDFMDLANPRWFRNDPELAWGFYGHRLNLYRSTAPHAGFAALLALVARAAHHVVFTSNVDGAFQKAGFRDDVVFACHGDIHTLQCIDCRRAPWPAAGTSVVVDETTFRADAPFPTCPGCGAIARPNVLMFGDWGFDEKHVVAAEARLAKVVDAVAPDAAHVVIECGAGTAIPSVRRFGEGLLQRFPRARLIRVNVREAHADDARVADRVIPVAAGAQAALLAMAERW